MFTCEKAVSKTCVFFIVSVFHMHAHTHTHTHTQCRLLVAKMKHVFEEALLVGGTRVMKQTTILKTFKAAEFLVKFIMKSRTIYDE